MNEYLGRFHAPDDRDYPLRPALGSEGLPSYRYWYTGPALDQGATSACVGYSWRKFLVASPLNTRSGPGPMSIYREAQKRDPWPGEDYDGTSVRAGVKYLQELGHIAEYRFTWSVDEVMRWVLTRGCIIAGTTWTYDMFYPDSEGFIRPTGRDSGGHAWTICGANRGRGVFRLQNSWGASWGQNGRAWISAEHLDYLLKNRGESCAALEREL